MIKAETHQPQVYCLLHVLHGRNGPGNSAISNADNMIIGVLTVNVVTRRKVSRPVPGPLLLVSLDSFVLKKETLCIFT